MRANAMLVEGSRLDYPEFRRVANHELETGQGASRVADLALETGTFARHDRFLDPGLYDLDPQARVDRDRAIVDEAVQRHITALTTELDADFAHVIENLKTVAGIVIDVNAPDFGKRRRK